MDNRGKSDEIYVEIDARHWLDEEAGADCSHWWRRSPERGDEAKPVEQAERPVAVAR